MDVQVLLAQQYLNATYSGQYGYTDVIEDGSTGWQTVYAILRALQIELGIVEPSNNFGPGTRSAFESQLGQLSSSTTNTEVISLLQCALWCKGYFGGDIGSGWSSTVLASVHSIRQNMGLSTASITVTSKMMKSLLSMDSYTLLAPSGTAIRQGQQWLNGKYNSRLNFYITPCDGLFTRQMQQGLMYALQYEIGMNDATANGNFGPGTKTGIATYGTVQFGSIDGTKSFVRLLQIALACNGYVTTINGSFDSSTQSQVTAFQTFMEIPVTGQGDYGTWAALLVSTGDPDRPVTGFDTSTPLTSAFATARYNEGYRSVGRYLTVAGKAIVPGELETIFASGLALIPIFQNYNNASSYFNHAIGLDHGRQAATRARELGIKNNAIIYFAVDYDATSDEANTIVKSYFTGIEDGLASSLDVQYRVGIYATRNVAQIIANAGLAEGIWVSGMSTGYSGNLGFPMPSNWMYNQIAELTSINIDKNAVSVRAQPLLSIDVAPVPRTNGVFHPFFWGNKDPNARVRGIMELQVLAEDLTRTFDTQGIGSVTIASSILMFWFQQEDYSPTNSDGSTNWSWTLFTPPFEVTLVSSTNTLLMATGARDAFFAAAGNIHQLDAAYDGGNPQHMAATAHGARIWGTHAGATGVGAGDLGGWALDLVTLWEDYYDTGMSIAISTWVDLHLGETANTYRFSLEDVIADADAWHIGRMMSEDSNTFAEAWRRLLVAYPTWQGRLAHFLNSRFEAQPQIKMKACVVDLFTSSDPLISNARDSFVSPTKLPNSTQLDTWATAVVSRFFSLAGIS